MGGSTQGTFKNVQTYYQAQNTYGTLFVIGQICFAEVCVDSPCLLTPCYHQGRPGTARAGGPGDLWHGLARTILARKILAQPGTENLGTENYWHVMARKIYNCHNMTPARDPKQ